MPSLLSEYAFLLSMHSLIFSNLTELKQGVKGKLPVPSAAVCKGRIHPAVGSASREHGSALSSPATPVPLPPALCPQQAELSGASGRCPWQGWPQHGTCPGSLHRHLSDSRSQCWMSKRGWLSGDYLLLSMGRIMLKRVKRCGTFLD